MNKFTYPMEVNKSEFSQLLKLVNICFPKDSISGGMLARWPHCYQKNKLENNNIIKKENKIVAHVGCIPQELIIDNSNIHIAGISGVATDPKYRGHGLMKELLRYCITKMKKDKVLFSYLSGDRQRYNYFGWENAGREWVFNITVRSLGSQDKQMDLMIRDFRNNKTDIDIVKSIHEQEKYKIKRDNNLYRLLLNRGGNKVYLISDNKKNWSYLVIKSDDNKVFYITEYGFKFNTDKKDLIQIFSYIFETNKELEKIVLFSPYRHRMNKMFTEISASWYISTPWMLKIIDLPALLKSFSSQIKIKTILTRSKGEVTLQIRNTDQEVSMFLDCDSIKICNIRTKNILVLTELEMVRLILGLSAPNTVFNLNKKLSFLDNIFPLDFYIWHNDSV